MIMNSAKHIGAERPPAAVLLVDQAPALGQHPLGHIHSFCGLEKRSQSWWREALLNSHPYRRIPPTQM
jgi:hypothetical protein